MLLLNKSEYEIKELPKTGRGVFATADIPANKPVADYLGRVFLDDKDDEPTALYAFGRNSTEIIWPLDIKAEGAHLINHSCAPNCMFYPYEGHILIVSLRKIFPGEELTCEYFIEPGMFDCEDDPHTCLCASPFCRGTLSVSNEYFEKYCELLTTPEMEERIVEIGTELPPLKNYPQKVSPINFMRLISSLNQEPEMIDNLFSLDLISIRNLLSESGKPLIDKNSKLKIVGIDFNNTLFLYPA